jgi:hypothetical protein
MSIEGKASGHRKSISRILPGSLAPDRNRLPASSVFRKTGVAFAQRRAPRAPKPSAVTMACGRLSWRAAVTFFSFRENEQGGPPWFAED